MIIRSFFTLATITVLTVGCLQMNKEEVDIIIAGTDQPDKEHVLILADESLGKSIDIEKSTVQWRGTKLMRTRSHEGEISIKEGLLLFENDKLVGGYIISNMKSIWVTDIPAHDTIPIKSLISHLNTDFDTQSYPTSRFEIIRVEDVTKSRLRVSGNLTIKNVTKYISVTAEIRKLKTNDYSFNTNFIIDRFDWNIGIDGSWLERKLVDNEIELSIGLVTK